MTEPKSELNYFSNRNGFTKRENGLWIDVAASLPPSPNSPPPRKMQFPVTSPRRHSDITSSRIKSHDHNYNYNYNQHRRYSCEPEHHNSHYRSGVEFGFGLGLDFGCITPPPYSPPSRSYYTMPIQQQPVYRKHTKKPSSQVLIPPIRPAGEVASTSGSDSGAGGITDIQDTILGSRSVSPTSPRLNAVNDTGSTKGSNYDPNSQSGAITKAVALLAGAQFFGKLVTFGLNQTLLRLIDPGLVGLSSQLELVSSTILYFSREAVRLAAQRQTLTDKKPDLYLFEGGVMDGTVSGTIQKVMNIGFIPLAIGIPLSVVIGAIYVSLSAADGPRLTATLLYCFASVIELMAEPCFLVVQLKLDFTSRASFESIAIMAKCIVTFIIMMLVKHTPIMSSITSSTTSTDSSILAFALGQLAYSLIFTTLYISHSWRVNRRATYKFYGIQGISVLNNGEKGRKKLYLDRDTIKLAGSIWLQTLFKHCLTEGDKLIVSFVLPLQDQGVYSLVSNYGSLLARLFFLPIEETLRNYFSKLLSRAEQTHDRGWDIASDVLSSVLRAYSYLSILAVTFGPLCADYTLQLVVSKAWNSTPNIGHVLGAYACFIPFLAINGCLEAFVQSVASVDDIRRQGISMLGFSVSFAVAAYTLMSPQFLGYGAEGLIYANMLNMALRIIWCIVYIDSKLQKRTAHRFQWLRNSMPGIPVLLSSTICSAYAWKWLGNAVRFRDVVNLVSLAGVIMMSMVYYERRYLVDLFRMKERVKVKAKSY